MTRIRKAPRWVAVFLRALGECGQARRAAELAGVDHTTVYNRRKAHPEFADGWAAALDLFAAGAAVVDDIPSPSHRFAAGAAVDDIPSPSHRFAAGPSLSLEGRGAELALQPTAGGARAAREGAGRWSAAAEKRFFAALADRANVRSAAEAAGFSTNAVYARRTKRPEFRRAWEAAVETGKARLQMLLMDSAERAFDPGLLDVSEEAPRVSVAEALNILKAREGKERELRGGGRGWGGGSDGAAEMSREEEDELRARFSAKLDRLLAQDEERRIARGWTRHGETLIPPGWALDPAYVAPPEEPPNMCEADRIALTYRPPSA